MAVQVDLEKCNGCGSCEDICPVGAIKVNDKAKIEEDECLGCCACVDECQQKALISDKL